jgi:transketolase
VELSAVRDTFVEAATTLLADDPRTAVVLAEISADAFLPAMRRHPDRVLNVGIREQLMVGVAGGLALTGMRPIVHSYAPFAVDRAYEQLKLDLGHQDAGAVVVSVGASYDASTAGFTHHSPADVALIDTLEGWTVHVPGHRDEVPGLLTAAASNDDRVYLRLSAQENGEPHENGVVRDGSRATVIAVGPMLDPVLEATAGLDVTVIYENTPRPFDVPLPATDLVLVEPYLAGTSSRFLSHVPKRTLNLGVSRTENRGYGSPADHAAWHGLDPAGLRKSISAFLEN